MRVYKLSQFAVAGVAVALAVGSVPSRAADNDPDPAAAPSEANVSAPKKPAAKGAKDAVAAAFKLPSGVTLNARQQTAYDALKAAKEPELRQAIEDIQNAKGNASSAPALKKVREYRAEIRKAIDGILDGSGLVPVKPSGSNLGGSGSGVWGYGPYTTQYGGYGGYGGYGYGGGYGPGYYYSPYGYYSGWYYPRSRSGTSKNSAGGSTSSSTGTSGSGTTAGAKSRPAPKSAPASKH